MLFRMALFLVLGLFLAGCPSTPDVVRLYTLRDTPAMSFETFRTALRVAAVDVVYEGLSPGFKERYGVPGLGQFKIGYRMYKSDFDELAEVLRTAKITAQRLETVGGRRYAFVSIESGTAQGDFVLVDLPTTELLVQFEGYDEVEQQRFYLDGEDFSEIMTLQDGKLYVGPFNADELGITEVGEVIRLSVQHQWLLEDIVRLANVKPLIDRVRQADPAH